MPWGCLENAAPTGPETAIEKPVNDQTLVAGDEFTGPELHTQVTNLNFARKLRRSFHPFLGLTRSCFGYRYFISVFCFWDGHDISLRCK